MHSTGHQRWMRDATMMQANTRWSPSLSRLSTATSRHTQLAHKTFNIYYTYLALLRLLHLPPPLVMCPSTNLTWLPPPPSATVATVATVATIVILRLSNMSLVCTRNIVPGCILDFVPPSGFYTMDTWYHRKSPNKAGTLIGRYSCRFQADIQRFIEYLIRSWIF